MKKVILAMIVLLTTTMAFAQKAKEEPVDKILAYSKITHANLLECKQLTAQDNKIGFAIDSLAKVGENEYFIQWKINKDNINQVFIAAQICFIDPDDFSNYKIGLASKFYGDLGQQNKMGVSLDKPSKYLIIYFNGIEAKFGDEYTTAPLFFVAELGNKPKLLDTKPRSADDLFAKAVLK